MPGMDQITMDPIGVVENGEQDARRQDWRGVRSTVRLREGLGEALLGLDGYSHVIVLGWLHEWPPEHRERRRSHPSGDEALPLQGAFALRGARPNPITITVCRLLTVEGDSLTVLGLDLIDGTPVLDVKPYIAFYDAEPKAAIPRWARG